MQPGLPGEPTGEVSDESQNLVTNLIGQVKTQSGQPAWGCVDVLRNPEALH